MAASFSLSIQQSAVSSQQSVVSGQPSALSQRLTPREQPILFKSIALREQ
ncbi:MAG: hypothetical protein F6J98_10415 [Moorea sp. SIO4G2]|nr:MULTISPECIES: hypothetical protein [Moorena]NEO17488.1 hypothetical protein [Moorena sp. SIO3E8]NEO48764.1 hypothetical protein [Moorena sp. SIO4A3]NEO60822.1 hypothetical protein [Moorena sp. SIO4G2]NEQ04026.1 hypothetical protein [Moorena sp. SIO3F7]